VNRGHVVLVGMMGSGKSSVGRALASRLERPFHDSDAEVEARTGQTVASIFAERGEAAFRAEEAAVLAEALAAKPPAVIAAAGGVVLDAANRKLIDSAELVVWLRADPTVLAGRVATGTHRPLLEDDPGGTLAQLDAVRRPLYAEVADVVVDVDRIGVERVVELIAAAVADREARSGTGR
jgi:shikimate kinase